MNANMTSNALAPRAIEGARSRSLMSVLAVAFGVALLALSAKIQVPFWPVPMTLQTLAVMGIAAAYGTRLGLATIGAYLALGFMGAPVFAGAVAGPAYFAGPTAGFLAGFLAIGAIVGSAADRGLARNPVRLGGVMLMADIVCFALGFAWLAFLFVSPKTGTTLGAATAFNAAIAPYVLADLVKIAIAALAVPAIGSLMRR